MSRYLNSPKLNLEPNFQIVPKCSNSISWKYLVNKQALFQNVGCSLLGDQAFHPTRQEDRIHRWARLHHGHLPCRPGKTSCFLPHDVSPNRVSLQQWTVQCRQLPLLVYCLFLFNSSFAQCDTSVLSGREQKMCQWLLPVKSPKTFSENVQKWADKTSKRAIFRNKWA